MFPLDPAIPIYINQEIFRKVEEDKRKILKHKVPRKFKNRTNVNMEKSNNPTSSITEILPSP
jgi:hypothetical protein